MFFESNGKSTEKDSDRSKEAEDSQTPSKFMENEIMIGNTVGCGVHLQPPYEPPLSFYFSLSAPIESLTTTS